MKEIKVIDHRDEFRDNEEINRYAVRAVIIKNHQLLLIHLKTTNEYKFPGGGVETNENFESALIREAKEEAGVNIASINSIIGYIDQRYPDKYRKNENYYMRSIYYLVTIDDQRFEQSLGKQETELGFSPAWVSIDEAIALNNNRLLLGTDYHWTERETLMLDYLKEHFIERL